MRKKLAVLAMAALAMAANAQTVSVEKYKLPNGMTVILAPDHSSPMVTINTWFRVGSKDEPERRSGFAHLFEHLMFMGTERVPNGQFDKIMEGVGGQNNASTSTDRTNYYSTGPGNIVKTLLWLDADRLQDLGRMMDKSKVDLQREVVRNERRQTTEQQPYGKAYEAMSSLMFPVGHPYHNSVIGSHEDLQAASVEDVQKFFATYYVPSNASLVVVGDFDPAEIKAYVAQVFGTLPRGNDVVRKEVPPVGWKGAKKVTMTDTVKFPKVILSWHSPAAYQPGDAAATVAAAILGRGASSRLYEELVTKKGVASEVSVNQDSELLGSTFTVDVTAAPGVSNEKLLAEIDVVLKQFVSEGPTENEVRKVVVDTERNIYRGMENFGRKADLLNEFEFYLGDPNSFKKVLDGYRALSADAVKAAATSVITDNRLELTVVPEAEKPSQDPRATAPAVEAVKAYAPPAPTEFEVAPGVKVSYWQRADLPLTDIRWVFRGGAGIEPDNKLGLASLAAEMMTRGTEGLNGSEFEQTLALAGASLDASADVRTTTVHLNTLTENLPIALKMSVTAMKSPGLLTSEWDSAKRERLAAIESTADDPARIAALVGNREYFGETHPSGRPNQGNAVTVNGLTLDDVKAQLKQVVRPSGMRIFAAGSLSPADFQKHMQSVLAGWSEDRRAPVPAVTLAKPQSEDGALRVVFVDKPDAAQTVIRLIEPGVNLASPDRLGLASLGRIMGGSFTSRLNQNLRENKGYTYGAGSSFSFEKEFGTFSVRTSVRTDVTGAALSEIIKELKGVAAGNVTDAEVGKSSSVDRSDQIDNLATISGVVATAAAEYELERTLLDIGLDLAGTQKVSKADLNRLATRLGHLDHGVLVLVGDKQKVLPQLKGLGLPDPIYVKGI